MVWNVIQYLLVSLPTCLYMHTEGDCRGHYHMKVGFTTTCAIIACHHWGCEFEPSSWRGVLDATLCDKVCRLFTTGRWSSPIRVLQFPPPIKLTMLYWVHLAWVGFMLTALVLMWTDCIGRWKSNYMYHMTTMTPYLLPQIIQGRRLSLIKRLWVIIIWKKNIDLMFYWYL